MTTPGQIPIPMCVNTTRTTLKCQRMCCRRKTSKPKEDPNSQQSIFGHFQGAGYGAAPYLRRRPRS